MATAVVRLGDVSDHGGTIISASTNVFANGIGVARNGDMHSCPIPGHGITPMSSDSTVKVNGQSVVRVNIDQAGCGAVFNAASPSVNAG
jgi:uncharacterized Zn-binding protein involved in type VI secretion